MGSVRDIEGRAAGTPFKDVHAASSGGSGEGCPPEGMEGMRSGGLKPRRERCPGLTSTMGCRERRDPAAGNLDGPLHVAVVDGDLVARHGLVRLLERDPRLHVMDPVARVTDLSASGMHFDVCFLDLFGVGDADEITTLFHGFPSVVCTSARGWRPWVAAWVCGAKGVVGRNVPGVPMADAAWDAVHRPDYVQPQLARALVDGITRCGLQVRASLTDTLGRVAEGRRVASVLAAAGISIWAYQREMGRLRALCEKSGLGVLRTTAQPDETADSFEPSTLPPEALAFTSRVREVLRHYADGYSYEEIAAILHISETTVKSHVLSAMDKFGITSNRSSDIRLLFAIYVSGRHRRPDLVRRRLDSVKGTFCPSAGLLLPHTYVRQQLADVPTPGG
jgi:DNA-binding CsgD family transcriptional regulator